MLCVKYNNDSNKYVTGGTEKLEPSSLGYDTHMNVIAVIPAKGNSERLPGKNARPMLDKPLIAWAIETARGSALIERVIVSTNDEKIAKIAKAYGAEVPFLEPAEISAGGGNIEQVLLHTIDWLEEYEGYVTDVVVLLLPTNPLRLSTHIDASIKKLNGIGADSVVSVCEAKATHNPYWIWTRRANGYVITSTGGSIKDMPRYSQDLPPCYTRNDICFVIRPKNLRENPSNLYGDHVELYVMDEMFDTDINTAEDWNVTEDKLRRLIVAKDTPIP
jgi:CMP-N,N'-diacetyllegionaminic acid synthase